MGIVQVFLNFCSPELLLFMALGVMIGITFGCIPGLNTPMALALILPLTYGMEMIPAISILLAVYCGGLSGGAISAVLLKIPGTAAAITTTFDGYPMAQKGEAMRALSLATIASFIGGMISAVILFFLTGSLSKLALGFGPWEYFGAGLLSLSLVSTLIKGDIINGFIATCIGLLLSMIGSSPIDGTTRFNFGLYQLSGGINIVVVIIGIFALSEILISVSKPLTTAQQKNTDFSIKAFLKTFVEIPKYLGTIIVSSLIGTIMGILPGLGGNAASMVAYSQAKTLSKNGEQFGEGAPEGIVAPEAANNAVSGGALIPAIALGVPGSSPVALIMSAFLIHGITIGPLVMKERPDIIHTIFIALIISNIFMLLIQGILLKFFARTISIPKHILFPTIAVFCVIGTYLVNSTSFNIYIMLICAVIGIILSHNGFPVPPLIMGYVLGGIVETYYRKSIISFETLSNAYFRFSVGSIFVTIAILVPVINIIQRRRKSKS